MQLLWLHPLIPVRLLKAYLPAAVQYDPTDACHLHQQAFVGTMAQQAAA